MVVIDIDIEFEYAAAGEIEFLTCPKRGDRIAIDMAHGGHHVVLAYEEAGVGGGAVARVGSGHYMLRERVGGGVGAATVTAVVGQISVENTKVFLRMSPVGD